MLCANERSQFWSLVGHLCEKAPQAAESLGTRIIEYVRRADRPEDVIEEPAAQSSALDRSTTQSQKDKAGDRSYRPPKYANTRLTGEKRQSARLLGGKLAKASDTAECNAPQDSTKVPSTSTKEAECDNSKVTNSATRSDQVNDRSQDPESPKPADPVQSTPARQTKAGPIGSPGTEEICRVNILTSLENVRPSPGLMSAVRGDAPALTDSILESVRIIHGLSKNQDGPSREVHATILRALRDPCQGMFASNNWSNGSMWMDILEKGSIEGQKVTILNMLEYMGAWEWYDSQVRSLQESGRILTKKGKPVGRRGAATHVLNEMQSGKWIKSLGRLTLEDGGGETRAASDGQDSITERNREVRRVRIKTQLSRGRKLSTKLVKELGFGILFSPKIW